MVRSALERKILEMERVCFDNPWKSINPDSICIAEDYGYVIGTQSELHRIAVLPSERGKGLSYSLMQKFLEQCGGEVFLEVASRNARAIGLYRKFGFAEVGRRLGYYGDDDGVVMVRRL